MKQLTIPGLEIPNSKYRPGKTFKTFSELFNYFSRNVPVKGTRSLHGARILGFLEKEGIAYRSDNAYDFTPLTKAFFTYRDANEEINKLKEQYYVCKK